MSETSEEDKAAGHGHESTNRASHSATLAVPAARLLVASVPVHNLCGPRLRAGEPQEGGAMVCDSLGGVGTSECTDRLPTPNVEHLHMDE